MHAFLRVEFAVRADDDAKSEKSHSAEISINTISLHPPQYESK
jgi:hypothetical protein